MATKYAISTEFSIIDRATAQLNKMTAAGKGFGGVWNRSVAQAQERIEALGSSVKKMTKYAIGAGVGAISAGVVVATKQYADFDQAIRAAGAAYGPAFSQAADFEDKIAGMGKAVRAVAAATEFDATQSANALKTLALAGVKSEQAVALLPGVADLATAAMTDMDSAVALAVGSLNTMGMMSDSPAQLAANMTRMSDVMAHTANSAYMSLQDVAAAISSGGSFFKTANNNLDVMSGSLTALAANSIKGAEAGTALRNIMTNLSAPTNTAAKALSKMGVQTQDAAGNLLPLPKIIGQFNNAMRGMGDAERNANLYAIFGKQNIAAVTALLNTGQNALQEYAAAAANSAGTVTANAEAMRGSLINKFKVLMSALTELGFKFVDALSEQGGEAIDAITNAINSFNPKPLVDAIVFIGGVIKNVFKIAWKLRGLIIGIGVVMGIWRGAAIAVSLFRSAIDALRLAHIALNVVMSANPIGIIIAAVAVLIGLAIALANKWRGISTAVDGFFARIRNMSGIGGIILRTITAPLEVLWNQVRALFDIVAAFKTGGIIAGIKMIGVAILQHLCAPIEGLLSLLSNIPVIGDMFAGWNERMHNWIEGMRADILAVKETEKEEAVTTPPPTATDAQASSYSLQESTTTNRLEVAMAAGLEGRMVGKPAPVFTIYAGR